MVSTRTGYPYSIFNTSGNGVADVRSVHLLQLLLQSRSRMSPFRIDSHHAGDIVLLAALDRGRRRVPGRRKVDGAQVRSDPVRNCKFRNPDVASVADSRPPLHVDHLQDDFPEPPNLQLLSYKKMLKITLNVINVMYCYQEPNRTILFFCIINHPILCIFFLCHKKLELYIKNLKMKKNKIWWD